MDILKLFIASPGSTGAFVLGSLAFAFYVGITYNNIRHMQQNMITKKDLELALANFKLALVKEFVPKER